MPGVQEVSGHDLSRAAYAAIFTWASAPAGNALFMAQPGKATRTENYRANSLSQKPRPLACTSSAWGLGLPVLRDDGLELER